MKRLLFLLTMIFFVTALSAQDITGTWGGVFYAPRKNVSFPYFFFLDIQQKGKTVWGVYSTGDSSVSNSYSCLTSVSATLSKKPGALIDLYKEKVEDFDKKGMSRDICNFVNRLGMHYFIEDGIEYITGKWYSESSGGSAGDGAGGAFVLHRIAASPTRNIDQYFPKLERMIEKGKSDEPIVLKADNISYATPLEKKLIDAMKGIIGKN
ncbi:MAG: hypothetical protein V4539_06785 [Bacteroidota bacterium]